MPAMTWRWVGAISTLAFAAACETTSNPDATASPRTEGADPAGAGNIAEEADRQRRESALKAAAEAFRLAQDPEARRTTYASLLVCLGNAPELAQVLEYARFRNVVIEKLVAELQALQEEAHANESALAEVPVKPAYEPPKYMGAYHLSGSVKRCYSDGVAIESGSKYYFLKNEPCPQFATVLHGYVEDTFDTVTLDLGRSGRDAVVVNIRDKETADDDRARFRAEAAEYQKEYNERLAEFKSASKAKQDLASELRSRSMRNDAARSAASAQLDRLLLALANGQPLDVITVDDLSAEPATVTTTAGASASKGLNSALVVNRSVQQATSKSGKRSPMACMKTCISGCSGDAGCERRCVAQDCR